MTDGFLQEVFEVIFMYEGLRLSGVVERMDCKASVVEDAIWELYVTGRIQINPDSTMRPTREDEKVFRYDP